VAAKLGDFFPANVRSAYCDGTIRPGAVFRVFVDTTNPPKDKILVVVGMSGDRALVGCLLVNSNVNLHVNYSDELRNLHIYLESEGREYLRHDSYLDCSQLHEMPLEKLRGLFERDAEILLGDFSEEDLGRAKQKVADAKTITAKLKKRYGLIDS